MAALSKVLRSREGNGLSFWCPGCKTAHGLNIGEGPGARWGYNGNPEKPTFTPSVLVTTGHYCQGRAHEGCWCTYYAEHPNEERDFECVRCHSFVRDGRIQFLDDCTHALAGQTVDLPEFPLCTSGQE